MALSEADWLDEVERLGPTLYRFFSASFPSQVSSDLVQDTFIKLIQKCREGSFDPQRGNLKAFAFGIARMLRLEFLRRESRMELVENESEVDQAEVERDGSDRAAHLRWAIKRLSPVEQEVILLMIDEEFSLAEIGEQLGMPLGTVKSHVHRAKERLKELMEIRI